MIKKDDPEGRVEEDFFGKCVEWRHKLGEHLKILRDEAHDGELAAFASYAVAFPEGFLALVDTYDVNKYVLPSLSTSSRAEISLLANAVFTPRKEQASLFFSTYTRFQAI